MVAAAQHGTAEINQRKLTVRLLPHKDAELYYSQLTNVFHLESLRLGSWAAKNNFVVIEEKLPFTHELTCKFLIAKRKIEICCQGYTLLLSFKDLSESMVLERDGYAQVVVYLSLKRPPKIFGKETAHLLPEEDLIQYLILNHLGKDKEDERLCDFTQGQILKYCSVYQLTFSARIPDVVNVLLNLARFNLTEEPLKYSQVYQQTRVAFRNLDYYLGSLPFHIRFKVESLINAWKIPDPRIHGATQEFLGFLQLVLQSVESNVLEGALDIMAYVERPVIFDLVDTLRSYLAIARPITVDRDFMLIARALITPTKILLVGPEVEVSNRVVRHYVNNANYFIRVSFVDEDLCQLFGNQFTDNLGRRFKSVLSEGFQVAGRKFEFLAYSSSQLREHGCWFVASVGAMTPDSIRNWMGDFSTIKIVAKYAARMGQCFSTTFETSEVHPRDIKRIPDIKTWDEKYTFSDGIGQISRKFAEAISARLSRSQVPSAFQCRIGGCKGMVAVNPRANHQLYVRPSMEKFSSSHTVFEVIGTSHFIASYLNRQIITLLSNLGIPNSAFERLQDSMVQLLDSMMTNDEAAKTILKSMPDQHDFCSTALKMLKGGFSVTTEPFLYNLLRATKTKKIKDLKSKTRILLKESACLIGVLDETKSLQYGQVFMKVHLPGSKVPKVITGRVFVVKNPAFHPGDIRVLDAVDCPALHHLVDCLVFPALGPRPHPSETSGSDLDGDIYTACWDKTLVPGYHENPGTYTAPPPLAKDLGVDISDIHNFFIDYMKNDILGMVANTHLAIADSSPLGPNDPKCLQLTELHSIAVDYPKTGVPAKMAQHLFVDARQGYPDFMEKKGKPQYVSQKILGVLYRKIVTTRLPNIPHFFDRDLVVEGFEEYLEEAETTKKDYNFRTIALMNQFGVKTEAELISGCVVKVGKQFLKKKFFDHIQRMCQAVYAMKKEFRTQFESDLGGIPPDERPQHRYRSAPALLLFNFPYFFSLCAFLFVYTVSFVHCFLFFVLFFFFRWAKASAWYVVTYGEEFRRKEQGPRARELLGFPWIMVDLLVQIKKDK
eukprot:Phypoly_transcript_00561.p1 GENE.Phypoly_transcript_00561~~Phypoly_transcript_00561.p1  ORF type:complete len:1059 (+),score=104.59 Phypoly_transcript_00561:1178-4354(+)